MQIFLLTFVLGNKKNIYVLTWDLPPNCGILCTHNDFPVYFFVFCLCFDANSQWLPWPLRKKKRQKTHVLTVAVNKDKHIEPVCESVWCWWRAGLTLSDENATAGWETDRKGGENNFSDSGNIFPPQYKELLCGKRARWEIQQRCVRVFESRVTCYTDLHLPQLYFT